MPTRSQVLSKKKTVRFTIQTNLGEDKLMLQKKNFEKKPQRREWERRNPDWHTRRNI